MPCSAFAFWHFVSALRHGNYLFLIPVLLLVIGATWLVRVPGWPSVLFTAVVVLAWFGLPAMAYHERFHNEVADPEMVTQAILATVVMLGLGLAYSVLGFAEFGLRASERRKVKKKRIRTPAEPPML